MGSDAGDVAPSLSRAIDVPGAVEVGDDPLGCAFGDVQLARDVARADPRIVRDQEQLSCRDLSEMRSPARQARWPFSLLTYEQKSWARFGQAKMGIVRSPCITGGLLVRAQPGELLESPAEVGLSLRSRTTSNLGSERPLPWAGPTWSGQRTIGTVIAK
jgi:hypothetical protein